WLSLDSVRKVRTGRIGAMNREGQGTSASEGRAPVSSDQAPVRLREGALLWPGQEYRSAGDAVRAVEPMDGAPTFADYRRRGAPVMRKMAAARCSRRPKKEK